MVPGQFITFEGGEGCGKSTQCQRLVDWLRAQGLEVVQTREPGGAPGAEAIRALVVQKQSYQWDQVTEVLLQFAARRENLVATVWPALARGAWVVCDRFVDSTYAYQGGGWGTSADLIAEIYRLTVGDFAPHLTLLFDVPVALGLQRAGQRLGQAVGTAAAENRYEQLDVAFHERVRTVFLARAQAEPNRFRVIDATQPMEAVTAAVQAHLRAAYPFLAPASRPAVG